MLIVECVDAEAQGHVQSLDRCEEAIGKHLSNEDSIIEREIKSPDKCPPLFPIVGVSSLFQNYWSA